MEIVGGRRPGLRKARHVGQLGPVIGMRDQGVRLIHRLKRPTPQMTGWLFAGRSGSPRDPATLLELDHVVLPDGALGQHHDEDVTDHPHPLPTGSLSQVVVAVPLRLARRVRDQLEDPFGRSADAATRAHDPVLVLRHATHAITTRALLYAAPWPGDTRGVPVPYQELPSVARTVLM